jgi:hypothetical protein
MCSNFSSMKQLFVCILHSVSLFLLFHYHLREKVIVVSELSRMLCRFHKSQTTRWSIQVI